MIKHTGLVKLQEVISRVLRHPMLQDVTYEAAIQYCVDFIHIYSLPEMYLDKEVIIPIQNFRGQLPCDLIKINQVKDTCSGVCLAAMTDTFLPERDNTPRVANGYPRYRNGFTFKVQNHIIFTSIENGEVKVNYKAIPVDEDGAPLIPDNPTYHKALELYIKVQVFTYKFDEGKIKADVLSHTEQQYAWAAGQLTSEYNTPDESEMESLARSWCTLIQGTTDFDSGFKNLSSREYLIKH